MAMIFAGESLDGAAFVLQHAASKAVGNANVQSTGVAAHDINPVPVLLHENASKQHRNATGAGVGRLGHSPSLTMTPKWEREAGWQRLKPACYRAEAAWLKPLP